MSNAANSSSNIQFGQGVFIDTDCPMSESGCAIVTEMPVEKTAKTKNRLQTERKRDGPNGAWLVKRNFLPLNPQEKIAIAKVLEKYPAMWHRKVAMAASDRFKTGSYIEYIHSLYACCALEDPNGQKRDKKTC